MNGSGSLLSKFAESLRFDGLWWRKFAYLGSVYAPEWFKRLSPPLVAAIIFALVPRVRRGALANMERVLGRQGRWPVRITTLQMFAEFAHCLAETLEQYGPRPRPLTLDLPEPDPLAAALRERRGAVLVTGHFGNWDVAAKGLRRYGCPINVVMAHEPNGTSQEYARRVRENAGMRVIYSDASIFSSLTIIRALQRNEIVAIQLDRPLGSGGTRLIEFFGAPAPFPSGPFVLARLSGAALIPAFIPRLRTRHYAIRVQGPFRLSRNARDDGALDQVMRDVVCGFEELIKEFPTQWFQFAPFWPTDVHTRDTPQSIAIGSTTDLIRAKG